MIPLAAAVVMALAMRANDRGRFLHAATHSAVVGQGQIKAADYVLVAEVQAADSNSGGGGVALGGVFGGPSRPLRRARSAASAAEDGSEHGPLADQRPHHRDDRGPGRLCGQEQHQLGRRRARLLRRPAALVGGGYDNTDIGRIVTLAFIQAYAKMVNDLGLVTPGSVGTAEATPAKTYTAQGSVAMRVRRRRRRAGRPHPPARSNRLSDRRQGPACGGKSPTRTTMSAG